MKVKVKKFDKSQLRSASFRADVTERICHDHMGHPIWSIPESVTYTVETDGEWNFDWYGVNGKFFRFNKE